MLMLPQSIAALYRSKGFWWTLLALWGGGVFLLSSLPGSSLPKVDLINFDKVEHTLCFAVGAGLLAFALNAAFPALSWRNRIALAVAAVSLFGWLDEWHQTFTPGRSGDDVYDWLSDTIGALIGAASAYTIDLYAGKSCLRRETARATTHQSPAA